MPKPLQLAARKDLVPVAADRAQTSPQALPSFRSLAGRYGAALLVVVLATAGRLALQPVLKDAAPFALYFIGSLYVAWYIGLWPALLTAGLGALGAAYFFLPPTYTLLVRQPADRHNVLAFSIVCTVLCIISDAQRRARMRAETAKRTAEEESARRREAEDAMRRQQGEIVALNVRLKRAMAETHHRVKNNLQVIGSMVELQACDAADTVPTSALLRIGHHVQALAAIHDILTREVQGNRNADYIDTQAILLRLGPLLESLAGDRRIRFAVEDLPLPLNQGTNLAVLINELVSNAVKHGAGEIHLSLAVVADRGCLQVRDQGPGFPPDFDPKVACHTGLELVDSLSRWDLGGDLSFRNHAEGGAMITVTFPLQQPVCHGIAAADAAKQDYAV